MGDCYSVAVSVPAVRPAPHWDALLQETLNLSLPHSWVLHIGESFDDVPADHHFYTFVENLFHRGVTTGCAGAAYCPTTPSPARRWPSFCSSPNSARRTFRRRAPAPSTQTCPARADRSTPGSRSSRRSRSPAAAAAALLSEQHRHAATDGRLPPQGARRFDVRPAGLHGRLRGRACPSQFADWIEELADRAITRGCSVRPLLIAEPTRTTAARWRSFCSRHSHWFFMAGSSDWDHLSYRRPAGGLPPDFVRRYLLLGVCRWWSARSRSIWQRRPG